MILKNKKCIRSSHVINNIMAKQNMQHLRKKKRKQNKSTYCSSTNIQFVNYANLRVVITKHLYIYSG